MNGLQRRFFRAGGNLPSKLATAAAISLACCSGCQLPGMGGGNSGGGPALTSTAQPSYSQNVAASGQSSTWQKFKTFVVGTGSAEKKNPPLAPEISVTTPPESSPNLNTRLAQVAEQSGNRAGAIESYRRALKQDPKHLDALLGFARLYDREGDFETALNLYLQAAAVAPENASVHNDLGLCFARQGRLEEASRSLTKAVALNPAGQLYRNNLATVQVELREYDQALESLKAVSAPEIAEYNLGYLLAQKQEPQLARQHFEAALRLKPQFAEAEAALAALGGPRSTPQTAQPGYPMPQYNNQPQQQENQPPADGPRLGDRYQNYQYQPYPATSGGPVQ